MKDGNIEVGDIVYLKSGSQRMTVTRLYEGEQASQVHVTWMHFDTQELRVAILPVLSLDIQGYKPAKKAKAEDAEGESYKGDSNNG